MIRIIREETITYGIDITRDRAAELMQQAIDYGAAWLADEGIRSADDLASKTDDELATILESAGEFGQVDLYSGLTDEGNAEWAEVQGNSYTVNRVREGGQLVTHYCTYCDRYSRRWDGRREPGSTVYTGTRKQVMAHAGIHPIGTPSDMVRPITDRAPYKED